MNSIFFYEYGKSRFVNDPNIFIEGITELNSNAVYLAEVFDVAEESILDISWSNGNCSFFIDSDIYIKGGFATGNTMFNRLDENLTTKVIDADGLVNQLGVETVDQTLYWYFTYLSNVLIELNFSEVHTLIGRSDGQFPQTLVFNNETFRKLWLPKLQTILYENRVNTQSVEARAYVHPVLKTSNNGGVDDTLVQWNGNNLRVMFVYSENPPNAPTETSFLDISPMTIKMANIVSNGNDVDQFQFWDGETLVLESNYPDMITDFPIGSYNYDLMIRDSSDQWTPKGNVNFTVPPFSMVGDGLLSHYDFEETTETIDHFSTTPYCLDRTGNGRNAQNQNLAILSEGKIGNGYYAAHNSSVLFIPTENVKSMCFWIKIISWSPTDPNDSYIFDGRNANSEYLEFNGSSGISKMVVNNVETLKRADEIQLNVWSYVYVEFTNPMVAGLLKFTNAFINYSRLGTECYIDLVSCYDKALTDLEYQQNYNNGNGTNM